MTVDLHSWRFFNMWLFGHGTGCGYVDEDAKNRIDEALQTTPTGGRARSGCTASISPHRCLKTDEELHAVGA